MPIFNVYHGMAAKDLVAERKSDSVVVLKAADSVEKAVKVLTDAKILAAPVVDEAGAMIGFVDRVDIASFIADAAPADAELSRDELASLKIAGRAISLVPVERVVNASGANGMVGVFESSPASEALEFAANGQHRVVLFSAEKEISNILSQSDFIKHMADNLMRGPTKVIAARKLSELGFQDGNMKLITVPASSTVLDAVKLMKKEGVSALAVVDEQGKLAGNFSVSDLKGLFRERIPEFLTPVGDFLAAHSPASLKPVTGSTDATLLETCQLLAQRGLHHVFLVDGENKPYGLVSQSDIMKIAAANKEE